MKFFSISISVGTTLLALTYGSGTSLQASGSGSSEDEMTRRLSGRIVDPAAAFERECAERLRATRPADTVWRQQRRENSLFEPPSNNRAPIFADREGWLTQDVAEVQRSIAAAATYARVSRMQEASATQEEETPSPSPRTLSLPLEEQSRPSPLRPSFMLGLFDERLAEPVIATMRTLIDQKELPDDEKREQLRMLETFITRAREERDLHSIWPIYEEAVRIVSEQPERSASTELNEAVLHLSIGDS